jgi:heme oxygenase
MLRGELDKEEYVRFLMMLWHIYKYVALFSPLLSLLTRHSTFERGLERHQNHPVLEPTYNPTLLARAPPLSADIAHLLGVRESDWKSHRIHLQLMAAQPPALTSYVARIQSISDSPDPSPLLAHAYVRYLGDLSGGQTIQRALAKAYGLKMGGAGLSFYAFKELRSSKQATQGEMKRIKEWFRAGMNKGAGDNVEVKGAFFLLWVCVRKLMRVQRPSWTKPPASSSTLARSSR